MIELTEQQRGELEKRHPIEVRDPRTNEIYAPLPEEEAPALEEIVVAVHKGGLPVKPGRPDDCGARF